MVCLARIVKYESGICGHSLCTTFFVYVLFSLQQTARVTAEVCCAVMESYSMSFRDCAEVISGKVFFIMDILDQLGADSSPSEDTPAS